ncbi:hypothetical protein [Leadbettera azotonutricia]|uniref:hypothetical protein n=1 Tax=Leadbettera azotonutricia TaxID=150829 RepID=UPI0002D8CA30|nr:hypothetical protein [Leadbettera azotonutricia]
MTKSKEQLENDINNSKYFSVSGENMEAAKQSLATKLVLDIIDYVKYYWYAGVSRSKKSYYENEPEIYMVIMDCLRTFNANKGFPFMHYLKRSIKRVLVRNFKERKEDKNTLLFLGNEDENIFPSLRDESEIYEDKEISQRKQEILEIIELEYQNLNKNAQTKYRKMILTEEFFDFLLSVENLNTDYSFIDYDMLNKYSNNKDLISKTDIAAMHNKLIQRVSADVRIFKERLRPQLRDLIKKYNIDFDCE